MPRPPRPPRAALSPDLCRLEAREVPAQFGVPWSDPSHLTMSFAPDGALAADAPSRLSAVLPPGAAGAPWRDAVLRAVQTWVELSNVNVGLVADGGQPFGAPGPAQGDGRFGDIRFGALRMAGDALGVGVPPDPVVAGTFAGDVFLDADRPLTPSALYAVALHEVGHALGLAPSDDPRSVMYNRLDPNAPGPRVPTAADVAALRALYGARGPDAHDAERENASFHRASRIEYEGGGRTPAIAYGDVTTARDVDTFEVRVPGKYRGAMTVRVQTAGVSLLAARVTVYDAAGRALGQATGQGSQGGVVAVTLPRVAADARYFVRVEAAPGSGFAVGRYGVGVTFDARLRPTAVPLEQVLRGAYEAVDEDDVPQLFTNPGGLVYEYDGHSDDEADESVDLRTSSGYAANRQFRAVASLSDPADADFFRVRAPRAADRSAAWVLTATVRGVGPNPAAPRVEVYDDQLDRVPADVLVNADGTFTIQAVGLRSDDDFFLRVSGAGVGNYELGVGFGTVAADLRTFAAGALPAPGTPAVSTLYVARTQLFGFNLTATGPAGSAARLTITDAAGRAVYSLTAAAGETVTGVSALLTPGEYRVTVEAVGGLVSFLLRGNSITDPVGPVLDSVTLAPQYQAPSDPTRFLYPDGTVSVDPFLWVFRPLF